ncbi:hypothetical protein C8R47DRAFT_1285603 [Mycena vitilis]|nr:hypothetical protein C8R47DRAFT_1285603 [Mycena vitilis]
MSAFGCGGTNRTAGPKREGTDHPGRELDDASIDVIAPPPWNLLPTLVPTPRRHRDVRLPVPLPALLSTTTRATAPSAIPALLDALGRDDGPQYALRPRRVDGRALAAVLPASSAGVRARARYARAEGASAVASGPGVMLGGRNFLRASIPHSQIEEVVGFHRASSCFQKCEKSSSSSAQVLWPIVFLLFCLRLRDCTSAIELDLGHLSFRALVKFNEGPSLHRRVLNPLALRAYSSIGMAAALGRTRTRMVKLRGVTFKFEFWNVQRRSAASGRGFEAYRVLGRCLHERLGFPTGYLRLWLSLNETTTRNTVHYPEFPAHLTASSTSFI